MPSATSNSSTHSVRSDVSHASRTSSFTYGHAPFVEYVPLVKELCRTLWPAASEDFEIERLEGGAFNRITGIKFRSSANRDSKSFILRVPRFDSGQQGRELAIHRYVAEHTSIPVADIISFDPTDDNPLGSSYVVQSWIPGQNLHDTYEILTHDQRKSIVRDFAKNLLALQDVTSPVSGLVEAAPNSDGKNAYRICRFDIKPDLLNDVDDRQNSGDRPVLNMLLTQFKRWLAYSMQLSTKNVLVIDFDAQLCKIAREMDEAGVFDDNTFYLTHLDLEPRNVLVDTADDHSVSISGILDWDSAIFAPCFASCKPPSWIWLPDWDGDENEQEANKIQEKSDMRELKQMFEEIMGPKYLHYAYQPQYRMARLLFLIAREGLHNNWHIEQAQNLFRDWAEFTGKANSPDAYIGVVADIVRNVNLEDDAGDAIDQESDFDNDSIQDSDFDNASIQESDFDNTEESTNQVESPIDEDESLSAMTAASLREERVLVIEKADEGETSNPTMRVGDVQTQP